MGVSKTMINHKQRLVTTNVFHRLGFMLGVGTLWVAGILFVIMTSGFLVDHNLHSYLDSLQSIPGTLPAFFNIILLAYFLITAYGDFQWSIQNGISRKTLWWGRFIAMLLSTIGIWIVDELLSLFNHPLESWGEMGMSLLILFTAVVTFQAVGNLFGLLNRTWKWIVGIGIPVLFLILMVGLVRMFESLAPYGYEYNHFVGPSGIMLRVLQSSVTWWVLWAVYILVMLILTKIFTNRMQLRRD